MIVYHGSVYSIERPLANIDRKNLDFGQGFYVTDMKLQAERWGLRLGSRLGKNALLNVYELDFEQVVSKFKVLQFKAYDEKWLDFIVANRSGLNKWKEYDYIEGGIADDRVIDTIEAYMIGNITLEMALGQLAFHRPNNQICLINQRLIDDCLHFKSVEPIKE
ncbi:DUF3990 domain-containing protein [Phocaeicola barnesiae]|uniref:DUF3990 domain-containing protein n=1 Tax=Phocaeicola barnesiae TaxID=376804 RepID=UPI0025A38FE3|nr:DUF3990 domain-containing protein [Phocaeicola barnesiae]MDM8242565.1 DUF3990 domain-containing protein [Phocaeicola barnesiae]